MFFINSDDARNLGIIVDSTMSQLKHINTIYKSVYFHVRNIILIRKYINKSTAATLIQAYVHVTSRVDSCNASHYEIP